MIHQQIPSITIKPIKRKLNTSFLSEAMTDKTLRDFSAPSTENIRTRPTLQTNNLEFELKPSLINMVQATHIQRKGT